MTILDVVLNNYLSKEDVQQIARDRGLPTGRTKADLIGLLLSRHLDPAEPLAFLNVTALRDLCREFGLDRGGDRDALIGRLIGAIRAETPWWGGRLRSTQATPEGEDDERPGDGRGRNFESAGPGVVVGVIATAAVAGVLVLGVSLFGTIWGTATSVLVAVVLAILILRTWHGWHPRLASFMRRPNS
jgi:hypothetical protein